MIQLGTKVRITLPDSWASNKTGVVKFIAQGYPEWPYAIEIEGTGVAICFKESELEVIEPTSMASGSDVSSPEAGSVCASNDRKATA